MWNQNLLNPAQLYPSFPLLLWTAFSFYGIYFSEEDKTFYHLWKCGYNLYAAL